MIRCFYLIGLWLACLAPFAMAKAHATASSTQAEVTQKPRITPTEDWELPSFDIRTPSDTKSQVSNTASRRAPSGGVRSLVSHALAAGRNGLVGRLARLTAYWAGEGDYYTSHRLSATGIRLHGGHCAVDPSIIPYGSVVVIPGVGQFLAVDTGSAVISRAAAREAGKTLAERHALVIDLFFEHRRDGERFARTGPKFASISWWTPSSTARAAREARSVFADEDWNKIYAKQL